MSSSTQQIKAKQRREKFAELLREMFQLNQPELDFGLYRIMHARKDDINRFIEKDLPSITQKAFSQFASQDKTQLEVELEKARKAAEDAGFSPEDSPKVKELQAQLNDGFDLAREEGEVYDALITFFNRYYSEGDFLSRRVYKDGTYAIPYQGEEVVLHWANKDQYYIKSSETLRDYSFRLNPNAGPEEAPLRVHFKLVDADAGAKDNNKETADNKRMFVLDAEQPFELIEGEPNDKGETHNELQCRFHFRAATEADWTDKIKANATEAAGKKPPAQDVLLAIAEERLLGDHAALPEPWKSALGQAYRKADGELADYSMLAGQLNNYTKKNNFDYFIHKDLDGFLTQELDFYIKNELLDWADIVSLKNDTARLGPLLSKIEVIRSLGEKIIAFLAQLENFQKKLWLKKKFVTETNYCITLDQLEEQPDLLATAFENEKQLKDWECLYKIDLKQLEKDRKSLGWTELLAKPEYRYMMVDTGHFEENYKARVLAGIESLDEQCEGLLVRSENFQALNILKEKYKENVDCIYIDPPYNTGGDGFLYKDSYQHASWLSMINDRTLNAIPFVKNDSAIFVSIDENEQPNLRKIMDVTWGEENFVADLVWAAGRKNDSKLVSVSHEYMLTYAANRQYLTDNKSTWRQKKKGLNDIYKKEKSLRKEFGVDYQTMTREMKDWYRSLPDGHPAKDHKHYCVLDEKGLYFPADISWPGGGGPRYPVNHPETGKPVKVPARGWMTGDEDKMKQWIEEGLVHFGDTEDSVPCIKSYLRDKEYQPPYSVFYQDGRAATKRLRHILGSDDFGYPKDEKVIAECVGMVAKNKGLVLDYFAGSGTTAHAVIDLNRKDDTGLKYILVEMGDYFDTAIRPRIEKLAYSDKWKCGKPEEPRGISHSFKYIRLESYEDALGNLALNRAPGQQQLLNEPDESNKFEARQAYVMNYMLEVETRDSQSLLNTRQFVDPTQYKLNVRPSSGDETRPVNVDLLETFNYLLGLTVEHIAAPIHFDAELSQGEYGRWQAKVKRSESGKWWFRTVYGTNRAGQQVLVVWRNLPSVIEGVEDGIKLDNAVLDAVLIEKLAIRLTESRDDEVDVLYVNGDHNIAIPRNRKGEPMEQARIQLIEEAFHRLMFADTEQGV
ncbi:site-specific DNA-methyltransferase [Halomonas sp. PAMB 3232]|uniref:site-specific DNA-methyltransferase n=1 Tax=Halomonas sp. PAMB 3232 TaxID=3075221 RepID=UPI0028A2AB59|nr:site-specific DNA-methyltransferase [Halomonas sp. PAMB 3232]WNL39810.1 site-specific DNA-methyltransferase [Halomonas sp. PAMB 3232]